MKRDAEERTVKHYAGYHGCGDAMREERRGPGKGEGESNEEKEREGEKTKGSHTGRMTGLLRRGEESGGYDRRRVQIITIIIFPGNMAAERGWPPGWCTRVGGKRVRVREGRVEQRARMMEGGGQAQAGRVIIILQTTAAGTYLYNPSPSLTFQLSSRSSLPPLSSSLSSRPCLHFLPHHPLAEIRVHGI